MERLVFDRQRVAALRLGKQIGVLLKIDGIADDLEGKS